MTPEEHFRATAPKWMHLFRQDFGASVDDAAAVFGNAGHESVGLTDDQEDKPVVPGSRGGRNWMQWTGPRRVAFEGYCTRTKKDPDSDEAAYAWMYVELKGTEKGAITKLKAANTLEEKVVAFEKAYLRAGVKHYDRRQAWAKKAKDAYLKAFASVDSKPSTVVKSPLQGLKDLVQGLAVKSAFSNLATILKAAGIMDFLNGYKTYIIAVFMVLAGVAQFLGIDIPSFDGQNAGQLIMEGFAILFLRKGIAAK